MVLGLVCWASAPVLSRAESTAAERATWTNAADNRIYAQQLVNEVMAAEPRLVVIGMHGVRPGEKEPHMIASNLDRIGKRDDDDDVSVANEHKTICAPNPTDSSKFEVLMPMKDASGHTLNAAIGFVFRYKAGDDEVMLHAEAARIRDAIAKKISDYRVLFQPLG